MERKKGQRWLWTDICPSESINDIAVAEVVIARSDRVKVIQVKSGVGISGITLGKELSASFSYKGASGTGGWTYLEGQDRPTGE
jgi:hypothetical protein